MKHTTNQTNDSHVSLDVELTAEELANAKQQALTKMAPKIEAPGFRKGKVPLDVAEKHADQNQLAQETAELAVNKAVTDLIEQEELRVLDQPQVNMQEYVPDQSLHFTAEVDVLPPIKLGEYKNLKAKANPEKVTDAEVDEVIGRMQSGMAEKKSVTRAAQKGDEVVIDFVGKKDGEAFDGGTANDYSLTLGSDSFIPGFEDAIVGHKAGEQFDVPLTFPDDYQVEDLKGQKVNFEVNLKTVNEVELPELNDEFAKKCGPFESFAALKDDVKRELSSQKDKQAEEQLKDGLIGELVENSTIPVPDVLVEDQAKSIEQDAQQNLSYRGQTLDQYIKLHGYKDEADWREQEVKPQAKRRVQAGLVLSELSKAENIDISKDELEQRLSEMKEKYPNMSDQLDQPDSRRDLANRVITEKTVDRLVELNAS